MSDNLYGLTPRQIDDIIDRHSGRTSRGNEGETAEILHDAINEALALAAATVAKCIPLGDQVAPATMNLTRIAQLIVDHYNGKPDDYLISIGDWERINDFGLPEFSAYMVVPLGGWREYANNE